MGETSSRGWINTQISISSLVIACSVITTPTRAQTTGPAYSSRASDAIASHDDANNEIIVTATKRTESLKDIPISISAFDGGRLQESGVKNIEDVQFLNAGLTLGHERSGELRISIRGISSNVGLEGGVAVHEDGVYLSQRLDQSRAYFDVSRLEVLRGPQGTLYGRNATGGAVNIITNDPTQVLEGGALVTFGNYGLIEGEAFASGPMNDQVAARIAVKVSNLPGYGYNFYTRGRVNGEDSTSVRMKIAYKPVDAITLKLTGEYSNTNSNYDDQIARLFPTTPLATEINGFVPPTGFDSNTNYPDEQHTKIGAVTLRGEFDLGFANITSITGYRKLSRAAPIDIDGSPQDRAAFLHNNSSNKQFSQEFDIASKENGSIDWLIGGYYFNNVNRQDRDVILTLTGGSHILNSVQPYQTIAYAGFGEVGIRFSKTLKLTLGGRYSSETSKLDEKRSLSTTSTIHGRGTWNSFTPKAALSWEVTPRATAYATVSRGFKSGGFNPGTFVAKSFAPEYVTNYEVGVKGTAIGGALRFSLAAFYMKYTDLQVQTYVNTTGVPQSLIVNAANATIKGVEGDFLIKPIQRFSIDGNFSVLNAKYDHFLFADASIPPPPGGAAPDSNGNRDVSGNRMVNAPPFSANVGATYEAPVGIDWKIQLRGELSYYGRNYFTPLENFRGVSQSPYTLVNARLGIKQDRDTGWNFAVFVRNITDKRVAGFMLENYGVPYTGIFKATTFKPPRTYGVSAGYRF